ncbi:unnamed protein product [Rotaria magnacalcarata]
MIQNYKNWSDNDQKRWDDGKLWNYFKPRDGKTCYYGSYGDYYGGDYGGDDGGYGGGGYGGDDHHGVGYGGGDGGHGHGVGYCLCVANRKAS